MPRKSTTQKPIQIGVNKNGRPVMSTAVVTSVYKAKGTKHGKPAMTVPVQYVTLPQNFYTQASKRLYTNKTYNGQKQYNLYVIGCAYTKNNKPLYIVAQLTYMGGKPAIAVNHYRGYSKRTAWIVFQNLPYHEAYYHNATGQSTKQTSDGTYNSLIRENQTRRQNFRNRQASYSNQNEQRRFRGDAWGATLR